MCFHVFISLLVENQQLTVNDSIDLTLIPLVTSTSSANSIESSMIAEDEDATSMLLSLQDNLLINHNNDNDNEEVEKEPEYLEPETRELKIGSLKMHINNKQPNKIQNIMQLFQYFKTLSINLDRHYDFPDDNSRHQHTCRDRSHDMIIMLLYIICYFLTPYDFKSKKVFQYMRILQYLLKTESILTILYEGSYQWYILTEFQELTFQDIMNFCRYDNKCSCKVSKTQTSLSVSDFEKISLGFVSFQ